METGCNSETSKHHLSKAQQQQCRVKRLKRKKQYEEQFNRAALQKSNSLNARGVRCYLCHGEFGIGPLTPTRDHVIPKSSKLRPNKQPTRWAHYQCNQQKENMPLTYFRMWKMLSVSYPNLTKQGRYGR